MMTTEKPILFSGEMVRAILDGRKTMTRRVVKQVPMDIHLGRPIMDWPLSGVYQDEEGRWILDVQTAVDDNSTEKLKCPYGKPGDRLWVRETWGLHDTEPKDGPDGAHVYFRASDGDRHELRYQLWRKSIYMPRWASRLTLEITDIRVERLQEITEDDANAEGVVPTRPLYGDCGGHIHEGHRESFAKLWDEINEKRGFPWYANPWVWVVEFRRTET